MALFDSNDQCIEVFTTDELTTPHWHQNGIDLLFQNRDNVLNILNIDSDVNSDKDPHSSRPIAKDYTNFLNYEILRSHVYTAKHVKITDFKVSTKNVMYFNKDNLANVVFFVLFKIGFIYCTWVCNSMSSVRQKRPFDLYIIFYSCMRIVGWFDILYWIFVDNDRSQFLPIIFYLLIPLSLAYYCEKKGQVFTYKLLLPLYTLVGFTDVFFTSVIISIFVGPLVAVILGFFYFRGAHIFKLNNTRDWKYSMLIIVELIFYHIVLLRTRKYSAIISTMQHQHLYLSDNLHCVYYLVSILLILPLSYLKYRLS